MARTARRLRRILLPPAAVLAVLVPLSIAALVRTLACGKESDAFAHTAYLVSAYTLAAVCARAPALAKSVWKRIAGNRHVARYRKDPRLRVEVSLHATTTANALYGLLQLAAGFQNKSLWFHALGSYYLLLALMRFFLLKGTARSKGGADRTAELRRYRLCGSLLLLENLALGVIAACIVRQNKGFAYNDITTIAMAAYTFCAIIVAAVNVRKYRRHESPLLSAAKAISLTAALVSVLPLETAMISAFGTGGDTAFRMTMTASTGALVCASVLALAVYMVVKSTHEMNAGTRADGASGLQETRTAHRRPSKNSR